MSVFPKSISMIPIAIPTGFFFFELGGVEGGYTIFPGAQRAEKTTLKNSTQTLTSSVYTTYRSQLKMGHRRQGKS